MMEQSSEKPTGDAAQNGCAYLGEGVTFKGSISVPEKVVVHGTLEGNVESRELIVGPKGMVKGDVRVDQADVYGKIMERAEIKMCLVVRKTGRVEGAVSYREIEIERGGVIAGELSVVGGAEKLPVDGLLDVGKDLTQRNRPKVVALESV